MVVPLGFLLQPAQEVSATRMPGAKMRSAMRIGFATCIRSSTTGVDDRIRRDRYDRKERSRTPAHGAGDKKFSKGSRYVSPRWTPNCFVWPVRNSGRFA